MNRCVQQSTSSSLGRSNSSTQSQTAKGCCQGYSYWRSSTGCSPPSSQPTGYSSTQFKRCQSANKRGDPSTGQQCTVSDNSAKRPRPSWTGKWSRYRHSPSPSGSASQRQRRRPPTKQSSASGALRAEPACTGQKWVHGPANGVISSHDCAPSRDIIRTDPHFSHPRHTWRQHSSSLCSRQGAHVKLFAGTASANLGRPSFRRSGCHSTWCRSGGGRKSPTVARMYTTPPSSWTFVKGGPMPGPKWQNNQPGWYEVPWPSTAVFNEWVRAALPTAPPNGRSARLSSRSQAPNRPRRNSITTQGFAP